MLSDPLPLARHVRFTTVSFQPCTNGTEFFATNSNFLIPISLQPNVVNL